MAHEIKKSEGLLACPFCGHSEPEIRFGHIYNSRCVYVRCPKCHIGNEAIAEGTYIRFSGNYTLTLEEAEQITVSRWNCRVDKKGGAA